MRVVCISRGTRNKPPAPTSASRPTEATSTEAPSVRFTIRDATPLIIKKGVGERLLGIDDHLAKWQRHLFKMRANDPEFLFRQIRQDEVPPHIGEIDTTAIH